MTPRLDALAAAQAEVTARATRLREEVAATERARNASSTSLHALTSEMASLKRASQTLLADHSAAVPRVRCAWQGGWGVGGSCVCGHASAPLLAGRLRALPRTAHPSPRTAGTPTHRTPVTHALQALPRAARPRHCRHAHAPHAHASAPQALVRPVRSRITGRSRTACPRTARPPSRHRTPTPTPPQAPPSRRTPVTDAPQAPLLRHTRAHATARPCHRRLPRTPRPRTACPQHRRHSLAPHAHSTTPQALPRTARPRTACPQHRRHSLALYANITAIRWDYESPQVAGCESASC
jgi:hypothetical protein